MRLLVLFPLALLMACGPGGECDSTTLEISRTLQNNSTKSVVIKSYYNEEYSFKVVEYTMPDGDTFTESGKYFDPCIGGVRTLDVEWIGNVDSVQVIFDNSKVQMHYVDLQIPGGSTYENNVILDGVSSASQRGYILVNSGRGFRDYLYEITEEDFNNAELIEGQ